MSELDIKDALHHANCLCRSALQIAKRRGEKTNWSAFRKKLEGSLFIQHKVMMDAGMLDGRSGKRREIAESGELSKESLCNSSCITNNTCPDVDELVKALEKIEGDLHCNDAYCCECNFERQSIAENALAKHKGE